MPLDTGYAPRPMETPMQFPIPEPIQHWLESQDASTFLTNLALTLGALWALGKLLGKAFPKLKALVRVIDTFAKLPDFMERTEATMDEIRHEVLPNNGGSLRDENITQGLRLEKIEAKLAKDHSRFELIEELLSQRVRDGIGVPLSTGNTPAQPSKETPDV